MAFLLFYVTHPDEGEARRVSAYLLERRLIACANIFAISSAYWWQTVLQKEEEWVSILKTRLELEETVENAIQKIHSYEVPCILRMVVSANAGYEDWIKESTNPPASFLGKQS